MLNTAKMRRLREDLGLTQAEAAVKAGLAGRQAWARIESGVKVNVTLATLAGIARALRCEAGGLLKKGRSK